MKRKLERVRTLDVEVAKKLASASVVTVEDLLQKTIIELVQTPGLALGEDVAKEAMRVVCAAAA